MADLRWYGPEVERRILAEMGRRLDACRHAVQNHAKKLVGTEGAGRWVQEAQPGQGATMPNFNVFKTKKGLKGFNLVQRAQGQKGRGKLMYGAFPSRPGEPPHKQTGRLQTSIASERSGLEARVGTNLQYGRWLELGTRDVEARPWLRPAFNALVPAINIIMSRPMPQ